MDLIPFQLGFFQLARQKYRGPFRIDLDGMREGAGFGETEQFLKHFNNIIVGMIFVVEKNHVVELFESLLGRGVRLGDCGG